MSSQNVTQYKFNINVDPSTWKDLKDGNYSLYLGNPEDKSDPIIPTTDDNEDEETQSFDLDDFDNPPIEVEWTSTQSQPTKYTVSWTVDGKSDKLKSVELVFGEAARLRKDHSFTRIGKPAWAKGALGFQNDIPALPLVYWPGSDTLMTDPRKSKWVPGAGTLKPRTNDQIYAWFYSDSAGGDDPDTIDTADFSTVKLLEFVKDAAKGDDPNEITYNDSPELASPWGELTGPQAAKVKPPQVNSGQIVV